jgi:hypothetical protein
MVCKTDVTLYRFSAYLSITTLTTCPMLPASDPTATPKPCYRCLCSSAVNFMSTIPSPEVSAQRSAVATEYEFDFAHANDAGNCFHAMRQVNTLHVLRSAASLMPLPFYPPGNSYAGPKEASCSCQEPNTASSVVKPEAW